MANVVFVNEPPIFVDEDKKLPLIDFIMKYKPVGWEELFKDAYEELCNISEILEREKVGGYRIVPDIENIFKVFYLVNPKDIKVIIWGQDPYHQILHTGKSRAQGLSFSVDKTMMFLVHYSIFTRRLLIIIHLHQNQDFLKMEI